MRTTPENQDTTPVVSALTVCQTLMQEAGEREGEHYAGTRIAEDLAPMRRHLSIDMMHLRIVAAGRHRDEEHTVADGGV